MNGNANADGDAAASSPPRKKARKGKKKSKAERLARGLSLPVGGNGSGGADGDAGHGTAGLSLDALRALLDAPTSTTSTQWDQAQAIAMRLNSREAKQLVVRSLVFDRQASRAAVHYARRLRLSSADLVVVLVDGLDDPQRCLAAARFLVDADARMVDNETRLTRFVLPWLDGHKAEAPSADDTADPPVVIPSAFATAARLVLQLPVTQKNPQVIADKLALQRLLVTTLLADGGRAGVVLQYARSLAPTLAAAAAQDNDGPDDGPSVDDKHTDDSGRAGVVGRVEGLLKMLWPDARTFVFGSSATGLLLPSSDAAAHGSEDVDLCVVLPSCPQFLADTAPLVADITDHLSLYEGDAADVVAVTCARVPIVKWTDPTTRLQCDLCINNLPALWNTQLTIQLTRDRNVRAVSLWMKRWLKAHRPRGFAAALSSYGMQLLVFYFLQRRGVLPLEIECGHATLDAAALETLGDGSCIQRKVVEAVEAAALALASSAGTSTPPTSLWSLVVGFFAFYGANEFDFERHVVSLRGAAVAKEAKQWTRRNWRFSLSIEDPIETHRDLGTLFSRVSLTRFRSALVAACVQIAHAHDAGETCTREGRQRVLESLLVVEEAVAAQYEEHPLGSK